MEKESIPPSAKLIAVVGSKPLGEMLSDFKITHNIGKYNSKAINSEFIALIADKLQLQLKSSEVANF